MAAVVAVGETPTIRLLDTTNLVLVAPLTLIVHWQSK